jgi:hypothetical protein
VNLVNGLGHPSDLEGPLAGGRYSFRARYGGDDFYNLAETCQPLTVMGRVFLPLILR